MRAALVFALAGLALSCHGPEVKPDELSAEGHRQEAARNRQLAAEHEARFDPRARELSSDLGSDHFGRGPTYNPTQGERTQAGAHRAHARAHEQAAAELERFEAAECAGVAPEQRAACPLLGKLSEVVDTPQGVRIQLAHPETAPAVLARMRCHLAFARARGFDVPGCPIYVRGLRIAAGPTAGSIDLIGSDAQAIEQIRQRAHEELVPVAQR